MDQLNITMILSQAVNFFIILFLFKKFLGEKLIAEIENRRATIAKIQASDKEADKKLAEAEKEANKIIDEARSKGQDLVSDAEAMASKKSKDILEKAEKDAKSKEEAALRNIEKEKLEMLSEMKGKVSGLVLKLNEKLF